MNIKGIGTQNSINVYNINSRKNIQSTNSIQAKDTIEISSIGKTLNSYDASDIKIDNSEKVQMIKEKLANGTYKVDSKLTAQSIIKAIKEGKEINE